ncbi:MAG: DUF1836 domain-containing protein [Clostridia bacterium]|nr:DUF1836 domain-containing protein [Clostridia bacterium]
MDNNTAFDLDAIIASAVADADLGSREIPNIDLYLDQILTLAADRLAQNQRGDKLLTKTMINNYSKDGLIKPVKGKKYDREHIVQMLLVYSLKQTLSIGEIKRAMDGVYAVEDFDGSDLIECYDRFLEMKANERTAAPAIVRDLFAAEGLDVQNDHDFFVGLLGVAAMSAYLRNVAQDMLAARYPAVEKEKKEKEKDKAKEKQ